MEVGLVVVGANAVSVSVPTLVVDWIALVISDPMETYTTTMPFCATGPSRVLGNAAALTAKGVAEAWNLVGSYWRTSLATEGKLVPGVIMTSKDTVSPTFFW